MPSTEGFWPAFWTLNGDDGWPPEIDIVEYWGDRPTNAYGTYHWGENSEGLQSKGVKKENGFELSGDFHTYGLEWGPDHLAWYMDGVQYGRTFTNSTAIAQLEAQYIIINLAIGGGGREPNAETLWPNWFEVPDELRYQRKVSNHCVDPRAVDAFVELSANKSQALLEELDAWLSEHEVGADSEGRYLSLGIYFYESPRDEEEQS